MIALRSDGLSQRTADHVTRFGELKDVFEIVFGPPTQLAPGAFVDVDAIDSREHRPATRGVYLWYMGARRATTAGALALSSPRSSRVNGVVELIMYRRNPIARALSSASRYAFTMSSMSALRYRNSFAFALKSA